MQLAEAQRLDLDAPVQRYCSSFPEKELRVTPRLLLGHLGGIRDYNYQRFEEEFLSRKRYPSVSDALAVFKSDPLIAQPAAKHQYSSFGYVLLGCVIEGAAGEPYFAYVNRQILSVAGLGSTRLDVPENLVEHRVRPYSRTKDGTLQNSPAVDLSDPLSCRRSDRNAGGSRPLRDGAAARKTPEKRNDLGNVARTEDTSRRADGLRSRVASRQRDW